MVKLKLTDIMEKLSKSELRKFSDYVKSPYFNKSKNLIKLLEFYKKNYKDFEKENFTKEKVFKKIFPGKEYNDDVFRNLNSDLLKLAEDFLAQYNFESVPFTRKKHLLNELASRSIFTLFESNFENAKEAIESLPNRDTVYFYNNFILYEIKDFYNASINNFTKDDSKKVEIFFIQYFISVILEKYIYVLSYKGTKNSDYNFILDLKFIKEFMKFIPDDSHSIKIYLSAFLLELTNEEKHFQSLKKLNHLYGNLTSKNDQYINSLSLTNYLKRNRNVTDIKVISEIFQLRKEILERVISGETFIDFHLYIGLVKMGVQLKEFDWVWDFMLNYKNKLIQKYRTCTFEFCAAVYYFAKKDFAEALNQLSKVKYALPYFYFEVKLFTAKVLWELNELETAQNVISSFKNFIGKNKKITQKDYAVYYDFFKCLDDLIIIKLDEKFFKLTSLKKYIEKNEVLNKSWLLTKISEIEKK